MPVGKVLGPETRESGSPNSTKGMPASKAICTQKKNRGLHSSQYTVPSLAIRMSKFIMPRAFVATTIFSTSARISSDQNVK